MEVVCCFVLDLSQLFDGPLISMGAAGVVVVSVGSSSCFTGLMGWSESSCIVVQLRSGM